jgi:hypothetical protein
MLPEDTEAVVSKRRPLRREVSRLGSGARLCDCRFGDADDGVACVSRHHVVRGDRCLKML